ncbi:MAG: DUF5674 family protein [Planctomycetota bacterium]|nr:DUF5674 family protein [Planctomycetota bacterium]
MPPVAPILIVSKKLPATELARLKDRPFADMVKFVVDVQRGILAVGGEMHVDAEAALLDQGSAQENLWGGNYFPGNSEDDCIEYTSLINVRPAQENRSILVASPKTRDRMRSIVFSLLGRGEAWV